MEVNKKKKNDEVMKRERKKKKKQIKKRTGVGAIIPTIYGGNLDQKKAYTQLVKMI